MRFKAIQTKNCQKKRVDILSASENRRCRENVSKQYLVLVFNCNYW